jgi:hypothetical protein
VHWVADRDPGSLSIGDGMDDTPMQLGEGVLSQQYRIRNAMCAGASPVLSSLISFC